MLVSMIDKHVPRKVLRLDDVPNESNGAAPAGALFD